MAKGAKRKTKWVSLSLAGANTTTSVATGSDSEHPHHQQQYGGGHRQKTLNGATKPTKHSNSITSITTTTTTTASHRVLGGVTDSAEEHHSNEPLDHSGNRTDTSGSSSSDCATGSSTMDRRPGGAYHRRRQPPSTYQTGRSGWNGGVTGGATNGGRGSYNNGGSRSGGYYSNGGSYYGSGRRSYYDNHTRRPANATGTNHNTTSGEGGGGTTINDDEYTRITTPRQDVLFKKGYLSRPKPATATATAASTSNENTASSSIAGTTSEGSDGGNGGGSNSISTTESITSEYGGSYAADAYPYPILPCGYFTETGVLVMNGFAMDNNGVSYFNGGQTYIYPPNFNNCQQQPQPSPGGGEPTETTIPYPTNDPNQPSPTILPHTDVQTDGAIAMGGYRSIDAAGGDGPSGAATAASFLQLCEVGGQGVLPVPEAAELEQEGARVAPVDPAGDGTVEGEAAVEVGEGAVQGEMVVAAPLEVPDYENGFYQFTDGYDFAQFLSSMYYPNWMMEQYPLYDDAGAPLYFGGEYAMPNGDVYPHQTSFKRRKKRFRTFDEIPGEGGTSYELTDLTSSTVHEVNPVAPLDVAPVGVVPAGDEAASNEYQRHADVRVFQPSPGVTSTSAAGEVPQLDRNHPPRVTKKPPAAAKKPPPAAVAPPAGEGNGTTTTMTTSGAVAGRPSAKSHRIARKDLIESTLAFAEQNIDLTRSKALAVAAPNGELECWTTVDRNGRKKRLEPAAGRIAPSPPLAKEKKAAAPNEAEQGANVPEKKLPPPVEVLSTAAVVPLATVSTSSASSSTLDGGPSTDTSTKKDSTKAKKKTKSSKRQLHRKAAGGFHKQHKQEGFQLIEPEFPSAASLVVHHRGRSCDNADTVDQLVDEPAEKKDEEEEEQVEQQIELESVGTVEQAEIVSLCELIPEQRAGAGCVDLAEEQITSVELNCDRANGHVAAGPAPLTEVIEEREDDVAQTLVLTTLPPSAVAEEQIVVNETETEREQQQTLQPETPHQGPVEELGCVERAPESGFMEQDVVDGVKEVVPSVACTMHSVEQSSAPLVPVEQSDVESASPSVLGEPNEVQEVKEEAIVEPVPADDRPDEARQPMEMCTTTERNVLTCAAKQLALGDRPSLQLPEPSDNDVEEEDEERAEVGNGCAAGSEEDEGSRGKRCSVSSGGYGENIDSGLQSPAPCGGVASPEVALMGSSIESDTSGPLDRPQPETTNLSQIVGKWLLRKLEVHETEELFVLPSDPRLLERLERFQLLVRRERPQRGFFASDSEDDGEDLEGGSDGEEEEEDFDSDYMSDGQGRLDRTAAGDTNPSSPLNSASDAPLSTPSSPLDADGSQLPCAKDAPRADEAAAVVAAPPNTHVLSSSDSRSINSQTSALRGAAAASSSAGAESKRCTIM